MTQKTLEDLKKDLVGSDPCKELFVIKYFNNGITPTISNLWSNDLPEPTDKLHIVVVEPEDNDSYSYTVLTGSYASLQPKALKQKHLLVIGVKMSPFVVCVDSTSPSRGSTPAKRGYTLLDDQYSIDLKSYFTVQAMDIPMLLNGTGDPIQRLKDQVENKARTFLQRISIDRFIDIPTDIEQLSGFGAQNSAIENLIAQLNESIQKVQVEGLRILNVSSQLELNHSLEAHIKTRSKEIDDANSKYLKVFNRQQFVNSMLNNDTTFAPFNLREIIIRLDSKILESFYEKDWEIARREFRADFDVRAKAFVDSHKGEEIKEMQERIRWAKSLNIAEEEIAKFEVALADKILTSRSDSFSKQNPREAFLIHLLGPRENQKPPRALIEQKDLS